MDIKDDLGLDEDRTQKIQSAIAIYEQIMEALKGHETSDTAITALVNALAHILVTRFGEEAMMGGRAVSEGLAACIAANLNLQTRPADDKLN